MIVFDEQCKNSGVTKNAVHPGAVKTETGQENGPVYKLFKRNFLDKILKSPDIAADALYYLGVSQEINTVSGKFFNLTMEGEHIDGHGTTVDGQEVQLKYDVDYTTDPWQISLHFISKDEENFSLKGIFKLVDGKMHICADDSRPAEFDPEDTMIFSRISD